jgi:release factor glutamine methyltransferase
LVSAVFPSEAAAGRASTVNEALLAASRRLAAAGIGTGALDAELLLRRTTGWDRARILTEGARLLAPAEGERFFELIAERARRRPLQHLTGTQAFWRHEFQVTPDVLIPRPETEVLVEAALERLRPLVRGRVVDVGTGSGCVALSLAAELPGAVVQAVDVSEPALAVARDNARRLGLEDRVEFRRGDLLEPLTAARARLDLVVSNPPYVARSEWESLDPEVRDHEPLLALVAPEGRERLYARLAEAAVRVLDPGGHLLLEIGRGMDDMVGALCAAAGLRVLRVIPDLQGIGRVVEAARD